MQFGIPGSVFVTEEKRGLLFIEVRIIFGHHAVSLGKNCPTFRTIVVSSKACNCLIKDTA
jgi:hypothetical protein